jgi:SpoU rRNA methylase family enzyme
MNYEIYFDAFNNLVKELTLLLKYECINPVKPQLKIKKIVTIVLYGFTNGFNPKHVCHTCLIWAHLLNANMWM